MKATLDDFVERRGSRLLLVHCAATSPAPRRPPAQARLEQQLGDDLTRKLLRVLTPSHSRSGDLVA